MNKKNSKKEPNWSIDEHKYLKLGQIKKLRVYCKKGKDIGLKERKLIPVRDWFMVELGLFCGLRVSEMVNLKVKDIEVQNEGTSIIVKNGKGGKSRVIRFGQDFKDICLFFLSWKKTNDGELKADNFVLSKSSGEQLTKRALQKIFKKCLTGAGLDIRYGIHCLRHTYGTYLYKASGYNLRLVQQQLGHSNIRTTQVYADFFNEDMQRAVERLYKAK